MLLLLWTEIKEYVYITDNENNLRKYRLPSVSIKAHDYLVVYFAGKSTNLEGLYANFYLSDDDENIILSDPEPQLI